MHMGIDETWKNEATRRIQSLSPDWNGEIFSNRLNCLSLAKNVRKLATASRHDLAVLNEQGHGFTLRQGDWPVRFRAAIAVELPHVPNLLNYAEIKISYQ